MTRRGIHLFLVFVFITIIAACTQQRTPCYEPKIVPVTMGGYRMQDTIAVDTSMPDPLFYCLDTPIQQVRSATKPNSYYPILSPFSDSTRWVLVPDIKTTDDSADTQTPVEFWDTITLYHSRRAEFISNACGYVFYYDLKDVKATRNTIDSIILLNKSVDNNANTEHIKIFF